MVFVKRRGFITIEPIFVFNKIFKTYFRTDLKKMCFCVRICPITLSPKGNATMGEFLDIANIIGVIGTTVISMLTLFTTRALQRKQQKVNIMANKRSERIDLMREYYASIISCGKHILYNVDTKETKTTLICYVDKFISLLQYEYIHDIELIDCANDIVDICLSQKLNKEALESCLQKFWRMCDIYVGVEHERLKNESMGDIAGSGEVDRSAKTFEEIYSILANEQSQVFLQRTNPEKEEDPTLLPQ